MPPFDMVPMLQPKQLILQQLPRDLASSLESETQQCVRPRGPARRRRRPP